MDPINQGKVSSTTYRCAYCGETNHTFVDPSQVNNSFLYLIMELIETLYFF
jgi:hypothetical protein